MDFMTEEEFVDRLHELRARAGNPSIRWIAEHAHVSRSHVSAMFRGHLGSWSATKAILRALGIGDGRLEFWHEDWRMAVNAPAGSDTRAKGRAAQAARRLQSDTPILGELAAIRYLLERLDAAISRVERRQALDALVREGEEAGLYEATTGMPPAMR